MKSLPKLPSSFLPLCLYFSHWEICCFWLLRNFFFYISAHYPSIYPTRYSTMSLQYCHDIQHQAQSEFRIKAFALNSSEETERDIWPQGYAVETLHAEIPIRIIRQEYDDEQLTCNHCNEHWQVLYNQIIAQTTSATWTDQVKNNAFSPQGFTFDHASIFDVLGAL